MRHLLLPLILSSFGFVSPAQALVEPGGAAEPVAPPREVRLVSAEFPVGGAIVGFVECFNCAGDEQPVFTDATGQALSGTFQVVPAELGVNAFVWLPEAPLALGTYSASLADGYQNTSFEVVATTETAPILRSRLAESEYGDGAAVSCSEYETAADYLTYFPDTMRQGALFLEMEGGWTQFFYSVTFDDEMPRAFSGARFERSFLNPVAICYEVTATPVLGGNSELVGEGCIEASESSDWGLQGQSLGSLERMLAECTEPPPEHFDAWCAQFEGMPDSAACGEACVAAEARCNEGLEPQDPTTEKGSGGATSQTASPEKGSEEVSGCTMSGNSRTRFTPWAWGGFFFLALAFRRRSLKW